MRSVKSAEQVAAVYHYTNPKYADTPIGYIQLNRAARKCPEDLSCLSEEQREAFLALHKLADMEFDEPVTVYRGVKLKGEDMEKLQSMIKESLDTGRPLAFSGITSTSLNPEYSAGFSGAEQTGAGILFEMETRRGAFIESLSYAKGSGEYEVIQPHGIRYRVLGVHKGQKIEGLNPSAGFTIVRLVEV